MEKARVRDLGKIKEEIKKEMPIQKNVANQQL